MGVLKLSVIEEQLKDQRARLRHLEKKTGSILAIVHVHVGLFCIKAKSLIMTMMMSLQQEAGTSTNFQS